jgi:hypothetical protein
LQALILLALVALPWWEIDHAQGELLVCRGIGHERVESPLSPQAPQVAAFQLVAVSSISL